MPEFRIRLFAHHKDRHGESVTITAEGNASSILEALQAQGIAASSSRLSVNLVFAAPDSPVAPGDELALIHPVSGG
jgi:molybdopterin converting factor small subunit